MMDIIFSIVKVIFVICIIVLVFIVSAIVFAMWLTFVLTIILNNFGLLPYIDMLKEYLNS